MPQWKLDLFIRIVNSKRQETGADVDEILAEYLKLTDSEKQEIKGSL